MVDAALMGPLVCSVGTSDPWNAAGIGLDIAALAACGARAVTVVTGVSAQDAGGLRAGAAIAPELIAAQFAALAALPIAAYRIGAMLDAASVAAVASHLARREPAARVPVVYDPVLAPSAGGTFADAATIAAIVARLVPLVSLVTPNLAEASVLLDAPPAADPEAMAEAGRGLVARGAAAALITGGHLAGDPCDVLVGASGVRRFAAPRLAGGVRGTGCLLACGLAAALARGETTVAAVTAARAFVRERIAGAVDLGGARVAY